jgi:conjugal transfer pilus assembly protein TraV
MMAVWNGRMRTVLIVGVMVLLGGCATSLNGYSASSDSPKCSADTKGLPCTPLSDVYRASMAGQLPGQVGAASGNAISVGVLAGGTTMKPMAEPGFEAKATMRATLDSGTPVRTAARVLRVWLAPWEDSQGILNDQKLVYLTIDSGRWLLEHTQKAVMDQFAPTRLVQGGPAAESPDAMDAPSPTKAPVVKKPVVGNNTMPIRPMNNTLEQLGIKTPGNQDKN